MSDSAASFGSLVPGFDFLQSLVKTAGSALPSIGQWVAPTLDPQELERRISELRTVQFWLEQNAKMIGTTIQALEVQRMTLSTLNTMNVRMADLRDSMRITLPERPARTPAAAPAPEVPPPAPTPALKPEAAAEAAPADADGPPADADAAPSSRIVDPMQWWGALTKQFTQIAASALKETSAVLPGGADGLAAPAPAKARRSAPAKTPRKRAAASKKRAAPRKPAAGAR